MRGSSVVGNKFATGVIHKLYMDDLQLGEEAAFVHDDVRSIVKEVSFSYGIVVTRIFCRLSSKRLARFLKERHTYKKWCPTGLR